MRERERDLTDNWRRWFVGATVSDWKMCSLQGEQLVGTPLRVSIQLNRSDSAHGVYIPAVPEPQATGASFPLRLREYSRHRGTLYKQWRQKDSKMSSFVSWKSSLVRVSINSCRHDKRSQKTEGLLQRDKLEAKWLITTKDYVSNQFVASYEWQNEMPS